MGRHIKNGVPYGGTVNNATMVKYGTNSTVANEIDGLKSNTKIEYAYNGYTPNGTVTISKSGFYLVNINALTTPTSDGAYLEIFHNNTQVGAMHRGSSAGSISLSLSQVLYLNSGDTLEKRSVNCEDRTDAYSLFQVVYIGHN